MGTEKWSERSYHKNNLRNSLRTEDVSRWKEPKRFLKQWMKINLNGKKTKQATSKQSGIKTALSVSITTMEARRRWNNAFNVLKKMYSNIEYSPNTQVNNQTQGRRVTQAPSQSWSPRFPFREFLGTNFTETVVNQMMIN